MRNTYNLNWIFKDVASILRCQGQLADLSAASIRTKINDFMDSLEKSGFKVNHRYNQELAVKKVRNLI